MKKLYKAIDSAIRGGEWADAQDLLNDAAWRGESGWDIELLADWFELESPLIPYYIPYIAEYYREEEFNVEWTYCVVPEDITRGLMVPCED